MQKSKTDLDLEILDETMEKREEIEFANDVAATKDLSESQAQVKDLVSWPLEPILAGPSDSHD